MNEKQSKQFLEAIEQISDQKGISKEEIKKSLEEVFSKMYRTKYDLEAELETIVDLEKGKITMNNFKNVVSEIEDEYGEVLVNDVEVKKQKLKVGDIYKEPIDYSEFSRSVAQQIKQMLIQKTREKEKEKVYEKFSSKIDELIITKIHKVAPKYMILDIDKTSLFMPESEMNPIEDYKSGDTLKVYVMNIDKMSKGAQIVVSRAHANFVKRLMEEQIVDIQDGIVEIVSIVREAGLKTKVVVKSNQPEVDPVGSCIGIRGSRIRGIIDEIHGEKIDVILDATDDIKKIINALSPAKVTSVIIEETKVKLDEDKWITDEENNTIIKEKTIKQATVIVPDDQNLIAIGKRGVNAKLAVKLTKIKIDIKTITEAKELGLKYEENGNVNDTYHNSTSTPETIELNIKEDHEMESDFNDIDAMKEYDNFMEQEYNNSSKEIVVEEEFENDEDQYEEGAFDEYGEEFEDQ